MRGSNYTGRTARSLTEAFGPYTSSDFHEPRYCFFASAAAWLRGLFTRG